MNYFKNVINTLLHSVGFDLSRHVPISNPSFQLLQALNQFKVDSIFDIGANVGQFASELRLVGFQGDFFSFEPLSSAHQALAKASSRDARWQIHPRCAIGDRNGEIEINVAGNSVSSSVLPMMESHRSACEISAYVSSEKVPIFTLDSVAPAYLAKTCRPFLKIDTQGFEWQVLDGAQNILPHMRGVLLELSLIPLYEGQHLWQEMIARLEREGFVLWALQPGFIDSYTGRTLQVDGIFFRLA